MSFNFLTIVVVIVGTVQCFINPYPRYKEYCDSGDPGEPLYLTEYIDKGQCELAKNLSLVNHDDMKWLTSYAGYLTVNQQYNSNMFFWFFPAQLDPSKAPIVLWLQGEFQIKHTIRADTVRRSLFQVAQVRHHCLVCSQKMDHFL